LKFSVLINNYNYALFLADSIESVLRQTYGVYEIIIVDDGSTDNSREIIELYRSRYPDKIRVVLKENGGQASAFNAGIKVCDGDAICFLDSDDIFVENKLESLLPLYEKGAEYVYNDHLTMFADGSIGMDMLKRFAYSGYNLFLVYYMSKYPGDVCSTLSISKALADKIFPIENESEWRIQADDCIVFQAAMMAKSHFLQQKLTIYRLHGSNGYAGKKMSREYLYLLLRRRNGIKECALQKIAGSRIFLGNGYNLVEEFKTHEKIDCALLKLYIKVIFFEMNIPFLKRIESVKDLLSIFINYKLKGRTC
jgi:glycosyltransferase involved in cell wall biosynthesis